MKTKLLCAAALLCLSFGAIATEGDIDDSTLKPKDQRQDRSDADSLPVVIGEFLAYFFGDAESI